MWNYFDNIAFVVFKDDSTFGMIKAFIYGAQGDYSHFTTIWTLGGEELFALGWLLGMPY